MPGFAADDLAATIRTLGALNSALGGRASPAWDVPHEA